MCVAGRLIQRTNNLHIEQRTAYTVYTIYRKIGIRLNARVDYMYRKYSYNRKICDEFRTLYFRRLCALLSSAKHSSPKWIEREREKWARTMLINISFQILILKELVHCILARSWYRTHSFCVVNQMSVLYWKCWIHSQYEINHWRYLFFFSLRFEESSRKLYKKMPIQMRNTATNKIIEEI